jgi:2-iminobutanoate/2-iminopropanoate deaminase
MRLASGPPWHALLYVSLEPAGRTVMPRQIITTANAPSSPLYSQGVKAGPHVLVSGIVGIDPSTGRMAGETIQDQTRQALKNCEAILYAGGASLADVIEVGVLLTNPADFSGLNEEYAQWFPTEPPTRYVAKLGVELPGVLVSIRMTAFTA